MDRDYDITDLLVSKQFSELNKDEMAFVLSLVKDKDEYNELRNIALLSRDQEQEDSTSRESVMAAFDREFASENDSNKSGIRKYWPYLAAAASLVVFLVIGNLFLTDQQSKLAEKKPSVNKEKILQDSTSNTNEKVKESLETTTEKQVETDQIAELKSRAEDKGVEESVASEMIVDDDKAEFTPPEISSVDDSEMMDVVVAAEKSEDQPEKLSSLHADQEENQEELADQPSIVSEDLANQQRSSQTVQSSSTEANRTKKSKSSKSDMFQIKRILADHYTSY